MAGGDELAGMPVADGRLPNQAPATIAGLFHDLTTNDSAPNGR